VKGDLGVSIYFWGELEFTFYTLITLDYSIHKDATTSSGEVTISSIVCLALMFSSVSS